MAYSKSFVVIALLIVSYGVVSWGQQTLPMPYAGKDQIAGLMRAKLSSSQRVVEGLMSGEFDMIRKAGEDLLKICDATEWRSREDQVYAHYRAELRREAIKLIKQSDEKSLDGAAYTYMHSMTTCISCHEYCRNVLRVALTAPVSPVAPIPVTEEENTKRQLSLFAR